MNESERLKKQKELIESIGRLSERDGYSPVAARIVGLLMVMDQEEYTFDEIVEELKISKSSASTALKNLEIRAVIEYVTYPGDRKRYFRFVTKDTGLIINEVKEKLKKQIDLLDQIVCLKKNPKSPNAVFFKTIAEGMSFFISKLDEFGAMNSK